MWDGVRQQAPRAATSRPSPPRCPSCRARQGSVCREGFAAESLEVRGCPYELWLRIHVCERLAHRQRAQPAHTECAQACVHTCSCRARAMSRVIARLGL